MHFHLPKMQLEIKISLEYQYRLEFHITNLWQKMTTGLVKTFWNYVYKIQ